MPFLGGASRVAPRNDRARLFGRAAAFRKRLQWLLGVSSQ
ncbi:hypothetical protein SAMN05892883_2920 [Jatrophihabitans sp. GAS493]|nr:hypothetical protein SAMN05892883_2920 [Jatrophihabitans sp. GAS493]